MPEADPDDAADAGAEPPLPAGVLLGLVLVLVLLLTVWSAFLVPLHLGGTPTPLWLLPFAAMLALASLAGRRLGLPGALVPALLWLVVGVLTFGTESAGGDLVIPGSLSGYAYLYGGIVAWAAVVLRASAGERDARSPEIPASPAARGRR